MHPPGNIQTFWFKPHPRLGAALLVIAAGLLVSFARRPGDFAGYILVGELALNGRHIYLDAPPVTSTWPPFFSLFCIVVALAARVSLIGARVVWLLLNGVALVFVLRLIARLVARGPGDARPDAPVPALSSAAVLIPLLLTARFVSSNFEHLQINILIFLLALGGMALMAARRDVPGALMLGAAVALKVIPALFIPYLAWRGRWKAAGLTILAAAGFSLTPGFVYGWARLADYFRSWLDALHAGWGVGKMNQSVYAMWDRIIGHGIVPFTAAALNDLPASRDPAVGIALVISLAVVTVLGIWIFRPLGRIGPRAELVEWSVVFLVASLFGTVMWAAYLVVLLLPNAVLLDAWRAEDLALVTRKGALGIAVGAFALGVLTTSGVLGTALAGRLEMGSIVTLSGLLMLGGLMWLRRRVGATA